jgi:hypothetical protein
MYVHPLLLKRYAALHILAFLKLKTKGLFIYQINKFKIEKDNKSVNFIVI